MNFYVDYNWFYLLICIVVYIVMLGLAKPQVTYKCPQRNNVNKNIALFFVLFTVNSVFALWSNDTYHYWDKFISLERYGTFELQEYELVYNWLGNIVDGNYWFWRFLIFTPSCFLMYIIAKKTDVLHRNTLVAFALFVAFSAYSRAMFGHVLLLFGVVLLMNKKEDWIARICGLFIICVSIFFHKSIFINIAFVIIALILPISKKIFRLSFIAFPFLIAVVTALISNVISGTFNMAATESLGDVSSVATFYADSEKEVSTIFGILQKTITYVPEYLTLFYLYNRIVIRGYLSKDKYKHIFNYLFKLSFVSIYIASLFFFVETSNWIYLRFKYMGFFPLVFVLAKVWSLEKRTNKWIKLIILLQLLSIAYKYSYLLYSWSKI